METYFTEVKVQADRYIVEVGSASASPMKPTIVVENKKMTEEEFKKYSLDEDCSCG
jgi:hypothetical protein